MKLKYIVEKIDVENTTGDLGMEVQDICCDSRKASQNSLFVAIPGFKVDGHRFIPEVFSKGTTAFVIEKDITIPDGATVVKVSSTRKALAQISNVFYGYPSQKIKVVGVTGTKGKTTITYFLQSIFKQAGVRTGRLSTINYDLGEQIISSSTTTPESLDLQKFLTHMVNNQVQYLFMEVSSHALVLHRVEGINFSWAIFTNLAPEHLDFHQDMEDYLKAKSILFESMPPDKKVLINADEKTSKKIMAVTPCKVMTYAIKENADFRGANINLGRERTSFETEINHKKEKFEIYIPGIHNVYNALAAIGVAVEEKVPVKCIREGLNIVKKIPGRLELIENKGDLNIYVDYAHTPSSLEGALRSLRELTTGKLVVVFGCGGDRDPYKRPVMGKIASRIADFTVITSDNPRSERPESIIEDIRGGMIEEGVRKGKDYLILVNRKEAIKHALGTLKPGDTLLVAGKGHEGVQIFKHKAIPFDDRVVVRDLLKQNHLL